MVICNLVIGTLVPKNINGALQNEVLGTGLPRTNVYTNLGFFHINKNFLKVWKVMLY